MRTASQVNYHRSGAHIELLITITGKELVIDRCLAWYGIPIYILIAAIRVNWSCGSVEQFGKEFPCRLTRGVDDGDRSEENKQKREICYNHIVYWMVLCYKFLSDLMLLFYINKPNEYYYYRQSSDYFNEIFDE